jgi:hypothetical protein
MNERIRELSVIAKNLTTDDAIHLSRIHNRTLSLDELEEIFAEKFAELILADYAKQLVQANMSNHWYVQAMDEHYEQKWAHRFG